MVLMVKNKNRKLFHVAINKKHSHDFPSLSFPHPTKLEIDSYPIVTKNSIQFSQQKLKKQHNKIHLILLSQVHKYLTTITINSSINSVMFNCLKGREKSIVTMSKLFQNTKTFLTQTFFLIQHRALH